MRAAMTVLLVILASSPASAYLVGPAVPLEELAKKADLVCKATVLSDRAVTDTWFDVISGYDVRETEMRVVSTLRGTAPPKVIRFRHYTPNHGAPVMYSPQHHTFVPGRTYVVFASAVGGGVYRQHAKAHTQKPDQGAILAADDKPHRGTTVTEAVWDELVGLLASTDADDNATAIRQLDEMSGGIRHMKDFDRKKALDQIQAQILSRTTSVAIAAIDVFGADSPYYRDRDAPYWLAGIGKGTIPGLSGRTVKSAPPPEALKRLLAVADGGSTPELRGLAIRALGRTKAAPAAKVEAWSRDPDARVRIAAVLVSAELGDRAIIKKAVADTSPDLRIAAAHAIGVSQDAALVPLLDGLLKDAQSKVRVAAALALLSFDATASAATMTAHLSSDFRPLFVNALARKDPARYLAQLGDIIDKAPQPRDWWGGSIPAGDSWKLLFEYVKGLPASELTGGKLDASLDALEKLKWFGSSEPRDLYALYLRRGLTARAKAFRAAAKSTISFDMEYYFDMVDKSPSTYIP